MNNYPIWWNDTITIYNRYEEDKKISWYRTVIDGCFWKYDDIAVSQNRSQMGYRALQFHTNTVTCRIRKSEKFLPKGEWDANTNRGNYFTIAPDDIIVLGEVTDEIDEYTSGKRSTEFISAQKKLGNIATVTKVLINVGEGRGNEHYHITGE